MAQKIPLNIKSPQRSKPYTGPVWIIRMFILLRAGFFYARDFFLEFIGLLTGRFRFFAEVFGFRVKLAGQTQNLRLNPVQSPYIGPTTF